MDPVARALGGKAATIEDVRQSDHVTLSDEASQSLDDLQERIGEAQELIDRQSQQISNKRLQSVAQELQPEKLRASGYAKIGGETMRVPTAGDMRRTIGGALDRATRMLIPGTERDGGSIFEVLGGKNLQKVRPAVRPMSGGMDVEGDLMYFGKGAPAQADQTADRGLAVMDYPGAMTGKLYGDGQQMTPTGTPKGPSMFISPRTEGKMHTLRMRQHYQTDTTREESLQSRRAGDGPPSGAGASYAETMPGQMYGMLQSAKKTLSLGRHQGENTAYQRIKSTLGSASPRRLFAEDSELWSASLARETEQGATPIADAVFTTRQALRNATDTYTTPEVFGRAARESLPEDTIEKLGGTDAILKSRKKTLDAAKDLLDTMPRDEGLQAPSASEAQKIVQEATGNLDRLYNAHGRPRAQTLRRFIAEQGALGTSTGGGALGDMKGMIDDLEAEGKLNRRAAREARAGLANLDIQQEAGEQLKNPYQALSEQSGRGTSRTLQAAQDALRQNRDALEQFGQTRDRVDLSYHRKAFTEPDYFSSPFEETGSFAMEGSPMSAGRLLAESGLETTRRALSSVGMGWNPNVSLTSNEGLRSVGKLWAKRGAAVVGGAMAYRAADTGTDVALPDDMPLGEGVGMAGADIAANAAVAASNVYDSLGITGAAQYMEGLMPKSTSMLPGAAAGYYAAGMKGAVAGAAINRVTQETFTNTPLEGLAIAPPLAPFVSDMTETAEQTEAEYQGRKWVPQRKGRFFMLSGTPYSGERIESYRPNWYTRQKAQSKATPALYGSKAEAAIFKDLPLIDFAPGDILDPQYLDKTQRQDRPYVSPSVPFSGVPLAGPVLGATVGKAYNAIHPMASNRPRHLEDVVGSFQGEGVGNAPAQVGSNYPSMSAGNFAGGFQSAGQPGAQVNAPGGESAYVEGQTVVSGDSPSAVLDEQFYRLSEAMGFTGFVGQQAVGGEGIFRRPRYKSASRMDSTSRAFHDLKMGDMAGVGEAIRRLYPFERGGETAQGPRNTQADFMPGEEANTDYKHGDPYCLTPSTPIEIDGEMVPAEEAYELVSEEPGEHTTRTHANNERPIEAAAKREVDEPIIRLDVEGLDWTLKLTRGHPVLVYDEDERETRWVLAGELEEGDTVLEPLGEPDPDEIQLELGHKKSPHFYRKKSGVFMKALHSLFKVQPAPRDRFRMDGPSQREMRHINHAFGLSGTKYPQRKKQEVAWLRRQMAERGLPKGLAGIPPGVVRVLIEPWVEEVSSDDAAITLRLTPENLGREELEAWSMRKPYEPEASKAQVVRRAAHRLMRVLSEADTPGRLEFLDEETAEITLRGLHASRLIYSQYRIQNAQSGTHVRKFSGEHSIKTRSKDGKRRVLREVESVEWESYEGPVYAFQVEEDSSFVAGGIATHNSKIAMGESLLPGAGLEATGAVGYGKAALEAEDVGRTTYGTALRMLGIEGREPSDREKWAKKQAQKRFIDSGAAVRTEAVFVDEEKKVTAVADAATQGNNPIHIEALSEAKFRQTNQPRELDTMRMNAMLGAADQSKGMIAYVNQQTGEMRTFTERFDSSLYNKTVRKMQSARSLAKRYAEKGYGAKGAMYSPTDRLRVLMNADPFGKKWQVEYKKAEKLYSSGEMAPRARREFEKIVRNHDKMRLPFEMYPDRFGSTGDVLNPPEQQANLTYNENVKSAAQYSLPERAAGAVYSAATSVRTPLHTKVFGNYNMREQYENRVLLDRDYQSWAQPVDDFVKPYMQGLAAADDPMQGALSYGLGGAVFGGPAFGAVGAITGSVYGAGRGAYESATGTTYVPEEEQELRRTSRQFDRMKYHRARRLYNATGAQEYREQMQNTAVGWTRQGLDGEGWAKSRRRAYSPEERMDSPLFQGDEGFSSPYRGLSKVDDFADAVVKHDGPALSLGKGVNQMDAMDDAARSSLELVDDTSRTFARKAPAAPPAAAVRARGGPARQAPTGGRMRGLPEAGYAKALRAHQTGKAPGSGEGFASPYQGQDPEQAVRYDAEGDPTQSAIPPEMLTAFGAVPEEERDFLRAGLRTRDPDQQAAMLRMVSDDFAAMMDVGWNYLHGQDLRGEAMDTDPMRQIDRDLASHPVMGKGANLDSYKIRTLQDRGMEASDAGLGWKDQMKRLEQAVVGAQPVSATMDGAQKEAGDPQELRSMIKTVLAQMGIRASVSIEPTSSPTEIHLRQRTQS
jgi:intein/homing endonuclease